MRLRAAIIVMIVCVGAGLLAPAWADDYRQLRNQARDRQRVIDAELRVLQGQLRSAEFGGQLYWQLRRSISSLESERSSLRSLDSAISFGREGEISRRQDDYQRARHGSLQAGQQLMDAQRRRQQFGSSSWYDYGRVSSAWQQQQRAGQSFGLEYRRSIEAQIRLLEGQRSHLEFGSSQWHAVNRQISALRSALSGVR